METNGLSTAVVLEDGEFMTITLGIGVTREMIHWDTQGVW